MENETTNINAYHVLEDLRKKNVDVEGVISRFFFNDEANTDALFDFINKEAEKGNDTSVSIALELLERDCWRVDEFKRKITTLELELKKQIRQGTKKGKKLAKEFLKVLEMSDKQVAEYQKKKWRLF